MTFLNLRSKLRRRLLNLFFLNPEERYYVRQLEAILGFSAGNIRNELHRLKEEGLFHTENVGNIIFYRLNQEYPLFNEIKTIMDRTVGLAYALKRAVAPFSGIKTAFIFGSFAADQQRGASDIDVMVIGRPDSKALRKVFKEEEKNLQREINYHVYAPSDWEEKKKEKNSFILNVLEKPMIFLKGDEQCL